MRTPSEVHTPSAREYPRRVWDWVYPTDMTVKRITVNGGLRFGHDGFIMVSTALAAKDIRLEPVDDGIWIVYYRAVPLGVLNERVGRVFELEEYQV